MNKIIFIDVDGTLINYKGITPISAKKAINITRDSGNTIFLCTGCSKYELSKRDLPIVDGIIGGNGTYIEYHDKVLFHNFLSKEDTKEIVDYLNNKKLGFYLESNEGLFCNEYMLIGGLDVLTKYSLGKGKDIKSSKDSANNFLKSMILLKEDKLYRDDVNKISYILSSYNDYLEFKNTFNYLNNGTWGGKDSNALFGDVSIKDIDKGKSIDFVLNYLNISKEDSIAFGDATVDLSMFEKCKVSVAMGNGSNDIKRYASYITDDVDNDGLYKAFEYLRLV